MPSVRTATDIHPPIAAARITLASLAALAAIVAVAFCVGNFPVAPSAVLAVLWAKLTGTTHTLSPAAETVIVSIRAPRIAAALIVGAALAASGATYQTIFRNPLVSPDILGVSAGASLGAVTAILFGLPPLAVQGFAFAGGLLAVAMIYAAGSAVRGHDVVLALILAGVVIGTLLGSAVALLKTIADPFNQLPAITFWLLGSLAAIAPGDLGWLALFTCASLVPLYLLRWHIDLLALSEDEARSLGVNVTRLRVAVVAAATLMTAAAVAVSGIIGWIGLVIPHAARLLAGPGFARMLPLALLLGAGFLLIVDTFARTLAGTEIPPGVLTAFVGTPAFLWLLARARRAGD